MRSLFVKSWNCCEISGDDEIQILLGVWLEEVRNSEIKIRIGDFQREIYI